jgi:dienelactone hydrolase
VGRRATVFFDKHVKGAPDLARVVDARPRTTKVRVTVSVERYQSGGKSVAVDCYTPQAGGKHPVILVLHGENGLRPANVEGLPNMALSMARRGYLVLLPHYFERAGHAGRKPVSDVEKQALVAAVKDAIDFAAARPDADAEHVGIFGFSYGAALAVACAAIEPRVRAVTACSAIVPGKSTLPTLLLVGSADRGIPRQDIVRFEDAMNESKTPHAIHVYSGVRHEFRPVELFDAGERTVAFFDEHVRIADADKPS